MWMKVTQCAPPSASVMGCQQEVTNDAGACLGHVHVLSEEGQDNTEGERSDLKDKRTRIWTDPTPAWGRGWAMTGGGPNQLPHLQRGVWGQNEGTGRHEETAWDLGSS